MAAILLIDAEEAAARVIADTLKGVGHTVATVTDPAQVFERGAEAQLIVLDVVAGRRTAIELCKEIRATPSLAAIPVLCIAQSDDVESRIAFLEVGADDVVAKPFDSRELEARVEALILRFQRSREVAAATEAGDSGHPTRRIVAVFSPKGGVGTTTIATNMAMVLAGRKADSVVIVDLDLQFGQVATQLDLEPQLTILDAVRDEVALAEPETLRTYTMRHESGLHVLAAPTDPALAKQFRGADVRRILESLLGTFDTVIVDGGSTYDEVAAAVFERAEQVIFPVLPEVPSLKALHRLLDLLTTSGPLGPKAMYVLNLAFPRELVRPRDVESALGARLAAQLPYDAFVYQKAVNEGVPVVVGAPKSAAAEGLVQLTDLVFPNGVVAPKEPVHEERRRGLFGRRARA